MKKDFTQPFMTDKTTAILLVEVADRGFVHFTQRDGEWDTLYVHLPAIDLNESKDVALELARFLHSQGFELLAYRELVRETSVEYSLIDDTPGRKKDSVCFYVRADMSNREIVAPQGFTVETLDLTETLENLEASVSFPPLVKASIAQLLAERSL